MLPDLDAYWVGYAEALADLQQCFEEEHPELLPEATKLIAYLREERLGDDAEAD